MTVASSGTNISSATSQQAVSALTVLPDDIFQESGAQFTTFGKQFCEPHLLVV
jgi:hypothetical protein